MWIKIFQKYNVLTVKMKLVIRFWLQKQYIRQQTDVTHKWFHVRFEVLTAVKMIFSWEVMPCGPTGRCQCWHLPMNPHGINPGHHHHQMAPDVGAWCDMEIENLTPACPLMAWCSKQISSKYFVYMHLCKECIITITTEEQKSSGFIPPNYKAHGQILTLELNGLPVHYCMNGQLDHI